MGAQKTGRKGKSTASRGKDNTPCSVLIVEDHTMVRDTFRATLEEEPWLRVAAEADNGREAIERFKEVKPDIVVMDIRMEDMNGVEATRRIKSLDPDASVVAVSVTCDVPIVLKMFEAGASAYVPKTSAFEELVTALEEVRKGHFYISPQVAEPVLAHRIRNALETSETRSLTPREREVLQLVAEGKTSKQIAGELNVSPKTVGRHRQNIMDKLNLHTVSELTKYAVREGLTSL